MQYASLGKSTKKCKLFHKEILGKSNLGNIIKFDEPYTIDSRAFDTPDILTGYLYPQLQHPPENKMHINMGNPYLIGYMIHHNGQTFRNMGTHWLEMP